jgi:hypothetical protein
MILRDLLNIQSSIAFPQRLYSVQLPKLRASFTRAVAQAVSGRLPITEARVRARVKSCGICGGQSRTGAGFLALPLIRSHKLLHNHPHLLRMVSSGMLRRVALVRTDVSEEPSDSFIRVTRIVELGTTLAAFFAECVSC